MAMADFGTYDLFQWNMIANVPEAVDAYDQHMREVKLAEEVGHKYHFIIEHQGNNIGQCTSPAVYLSALGAADQKHPVRGHDFPVALLQPHEAGPRRRYVGPTVPRALGVRGWSGRVVPRVHALEHPL